MVVIDTPQLEDHTAIARSALRHADEIVIPCAPNPIEINRTTPVRDEIAEMNPSAQARALGHPAQPLHHPGALVSEARQALQELGYDVLPATVPRLEVYAQSFGMPIRDTGRDVRRQVTRDLLARCPAPCPVRP